VSHARSVIAPPQQLLDEWRWPFEHCLDRSVREIARRTGDTEEASLAAA
jgi:hypothetical protein